MACIALLLPKLVCCVPANAQGGGRRPTSSAGVSYFLRQRYSYASFLRHFHMAAVPIDFRPAPRFRCYSPESPAGGKLAADRRKLLPISPNFAACAFLRFVMQARGIRWVGSTSRQTGTKKVLGNYDFGAAPAHACHPQWRTGRPGLRAADAVRGVSRG